MSTSDAAPTPAAPRPLRKDAERNRQRILIAARELFAERGLTSIDDVAAHAGVGVGTVYRRFASRDDLVDALFEESIEEITVYAEQCLARAEQDPLGALEDYLYFYLGKHADDRALSEVVMTDLHGRGGLAAKKAKLRPYVLQLVQHAKDAGRVRADLDPTDVPMMLMMVVTVINASRPVAPELWRRQLRLILDGWEAQPGSALPQTQPAGVEQVQEIMRRGLGPRR